MILTCNDNIDLQYAQKLVSNQYYRYITITMVFFMLSFMTIMIIIAYGNYSHAQHILDLTETLANSQYLTLCNRYIDETEIQEVFAVIDNAQYKYNLFRNVTSITKLTDNNSIYIYKLSNLKVPIYLHKKDIQAVIHHIDNCWSIEEKKYIFSIEQLYTKHNETQIQDLYNMDLIYKAMTNQDVFDQQNLEQVHNIIESTSRDQKVTYQL